MWIRRNAPPREPPRVKIEEYADVVELVDSLDLGAVTLGKYLNSHCIIKGIKSMSRYKIYDADNNFVGEIIEDAKESASETITSGEVNWAGILGLVLLVALLWVLSLVWKALWPVIVFLCRLLWWTVRAIAFIAWWVVQEALYAFWWLVRLPFLIIFHKEAPKWWFPELIFPEW